nr:immunoglobulin light chain junction region [Macaca mulatta]MOV62674.1 immunoglobulin light chain junction region [Macaca mulatta]MOV63240.1 immunoglobulin light chain junction region [Macaca mulatta]MOV63278.1 immunoglobulin light chain junction region [Macaca mulatta]MOV64583.1 immunoglobulin light chain junction region [Macaca mulatta]
CQQSFTYPYSF